MIEINSSELKTVTEYLQVYDYGWSLDDRIEHIHKMVRDGFVVTRSWTTDKGYHTSFVKSSIDSHRKYVKDAVKSSYKRIPGDKLEEVCTPEEVNIG